MAAVAGGDEAIAMITNGRFYVWICVTVGIVATHWTNGISWSDVATADFYAGFSLLFHYMVNEGGTRFKAWLHRVTA
jgi:hypothetical protein